MKFLMGGTMYAKKNLASKILIFRRFWLKKFLASPFKVPTPKCFRGVRPNKAIFADVTP